MLSTTVNMRGRAHTTYNVSNRGQHAGRTAPRCTAVRSPPLTAGCATCHFMAALHQIDLKDVGSNSKISIKVRPADKIEGE